MKTSIYNRVIRIANAANSKEDYYRELSRLYNTEEVPPDMAYKIWHTETQLRKNKRYSRGKTHAD